MSPRELINDAWRQFILNLVYWTCKYICFRHVYPNMCIYVSQTLLNHYPFMYDVCFCFSVHDLITSKYEFVRDINGV